jgi:hypothetical protein
MLMTRNTGFLVVCCLPLHYLPIIHQVYLAGPDVFLPREVALRTAKAKKAVCCELGLVGVFPFDLEAQGRQKVFLCACADTIMSLFCPISGLAVS